MHDEPTLAGPGRAGWPPPPPDRARGRRRGPLALLAAAVAALVLATTVLVVVLVDDGGDPAPRDTDAAPGDPAPPTGSERTEEAAELSDWLAPAAPLTVGQEPLVSPCRALTSADVAEIYGGADGGADVDVYETTYDTSVTTLPDLRESVDTRCEHDGLTELSAQQFLSRDLLEDLGIGSAGSSLEGDRERAVKLQRYQDAADLADDEDVRTFITGVVDAGRTLQRYRDSYDAAVFDGYELDEVVLPVGPGPFMVRFFVDNVAFTVGLDPFDDVDLAALPDAEVLAGLAQAEAAVARVRERVADAGLSQSPAPTSRPDAAYGTTRVLEPCAILTRAVFRRATGRAVRGPVERLVLAEHLAEAGPQPSDLGGGLSSGHYCRRESRMVARDGSTDQVTAELRLRYAASVRTLDDALRSQGYRPDGPEVTRLRTAADWAVETTGSSRAYTFSVGPYLLNLDLTTLRSDGTVGGDPVQGRPDRAALVRAIDLLVPALRRHLAAVER